MTRLQDSKKREGMPSLKVKKKIEQVSLEAIQRLDMFSLGCSMVVSFIFLCSSMFFPLLEGMIHCS